ncbi:MAG: trehalose-phosphatase [Actinomycetota bacterium]
MPPPHEVAAALAPLRARLRDAAVLLDLDGTLAAIRPRPQDVTLDPGVRDAVTRLCRAARTVALVSGRGLRDLEGIAAIPECVYVGNHGMEVRDPDGRRRVPDAVAAHRDAIAAFAARWPATLLAPHGVTLEDKGVTLSFHYRTAPDPADAHAWVEREVAAAAVAAGLRPTAGRMVTEVRPPVAVDKGTAVRDLVARSGARLAVYFGDDRTDVDAWRVLTQLRRDGVLDGCVAVAVVGDETPPEVRAAADVAVRGPAEVLATLEWLGDAAGHGAAGGVTPS